MWDFENEKAVKCWSDMHHKTVTIIMGLCCCVDCLSGAPNICFRFDASGCVLDVEYWHSLSSVECFAGISDPSPMVCF